MTNDRDASLVPIPKTDYRLRRNLKALNRVQKAGRSAALAADS